MKVTIHLSEWSIRFLSRRVGPDRRGRRPQADSRSGLIGRVLQRYEWLVNEGVEELAITDDEAEALLQVLTLPLDEPSLLGRLHHEIRETVLATRDLSQETAALLTGLARRIESSTPLATLALVDRLERARSRTETHT